MAIKSTPKLNITNIKSPLTGVKSSIAKIPFGGAAKTLKLQPLIKPIQSISEQPTKLVDTISANIETINRIIKVEEKVRINEEKITGVNGIINSLKENISSIGDSVKDTIGAIKHLSNEFASFIIRESEVKRKQAEELKKAQKKEDEQLLKKSKEDKLEESDKKDNKLLSPVKAVGKRMRGILSQITEVFSLIFGGWLVDKGIKMWKANKDGNTKEFEEIKSEVIKTVAIIGGTFLTIQGVLSNLPTIILGVSATIAGLAAPIVAFLLSPPGLATLALAAGITAAVLGANWVKKWKAGGQLMLDLHEANQKKFNEIEWEEGDLPLRWNPTGGWHGAGQIEAQRVIKFTDAPGAPRYGGLSMLGKGGKDFTKKWVKWEEVKDQLKPYQLEQIRDFQAQRSHIKNFHKKQLAEEIARKQSFVQESGVREDGTRFFTDDDEREKKLIASLVEKEYAAKMFKEGHNINTKRWGLSSKGEMITDSTIQSNIDNFAKQMENLQLNNQSSTIIVNPIPVNNNATETTSDNGYEVYEGARNGDSNANADALAETGLYEY